MDAINDRSRALLAAIVDSCDDAIIGMNLEAKIISWNKAAERIFGYTEKEAIGQSIMMLVPPERAEEEPDILRRVQSGERIRHYETLRRAKDGSYVDISLAVSPVVDSGGKIIAISKVARDIGPRRSARERLRRSEERFRVTLSSIGDAVIATDSRERITFLNPVAERLTGWKSQQAVGAPLTDVFKIINEYSREPVENPVTNVLREGGIVGLANHTVLVSKDGSERPIDDSGAPIRGSSGELIGVVLVFRDVTERRRAELATLRLAAIVQNSDDAIVSKDLEGIITTWNEGAQQIFGYAAEEIIGKPIYTLIPPGLRSQEDEILRRLRRGERIFHFETIRVAKDGRQIPVSLTISPIKDAKGRVIGASKIARDISERKQAEKNLAEARQQLQNRALGLEQLVQERTRTLEKTVKELEAFSYSLSHDMRAPLRAIQSFSEIVMNDYGDKIGVEGKEMLGRSLHAAERMDNLILDLLTFTRLSSTLVAIEPVDLEKLLRGIIQERVEFQPPRAEIRVETPLMRAAGDEASLTQCITNLLENAVKFVTPEVTPRVRVHTERRGKRIRLWFEDNGIGIEPEAKPRLFQMFQRLHSEAYPGTGIGLAIVRKAVERLGGEVGVESEPGRGSRFWLDLQEAET